MFLASTKVEVIAQQAFLLSHAVENCRCSHDVEGLQLDLQLLSVQAQGYSAVLSQFLDGLTKSAHMKFDALKVREAREETIKQIQRAEQAAAPPAAGLQKEIYTRFMTRDERALFDSIDPGKEYKIVTLNDRGELVTEEMVQGGRVRDALTRVKYHSLPEQHKSQVPQEHRPDPAWPERKRDMAIVEGLATGRRLHRPEPMVDAAHTPIDLDRPSLKRVEMTPKTVREVREVRTAFVTANEKIDGLDVLRKQIDREMAAMEQKLPARTPLEAQMKKALMPHKEQECKQKFGLEKEQTAMAKTLREDVLEEAVLGHTPPPGRVAERAAANCNRAQAPVTKETADKNWEEAVACMPWSETAETPAPSGLKKGGSGGVTL